MELNVGDKFELEVIDLCSNNKGRDYILALGPDDVSYNIYNILKCQFTSLPDTIYGEAIKLDNNGKMIVRQDEQRVLQEHYELGKYYTFTISDQSEDNNKVKYYVLEDDFACHRWYTLDDYAIGESIILEAKSLSKNGYINFATHNTPQSIQNIPTEKTVVRVAPSGNFPVFSGPDEDEHVEYKTSIVFTPKSSVPNIDAQCLEITKELAAFMNADGGTLYIGIHDKTREILGFQGDLPYLNTGNSEYASSYTPDEDHYQLKIRDMLVQYTSGNAGSLIHVNFKEEQGAKYCEIVAEKASFPVWVKGNLLYERQGNQKRMLRGDAITQYICRRMSSVFQAGNTTSEGISAGSLSETIHHAVYNAINKRRQEVAAPVAATTNDTPKYWIVWLSDGSFVKQKQKSEDANVYKQIPVYDDGDDMMVVFCYKSGTVNRVEFKTFRKGANLNKVRPGGVNMAEELVDLYITHTSRLLAIYSADQGGTEYLKIHHLTDVNTTTSGKNKGSNVIPPKKGQILKCKLLTPVEAREASALIAAKSETTKSFGRNIHDIQVTQEIAYVDGL